jgi:hypothetical protein
LTKKECLKRDCKNALDAECRYDECCGAASTTVKNEGKKFFLIKGDPKAFDFNKNFFPSFFTVFDVAPHHSS